MIFLLILKWIGIILLSLLGLILLILLLILFFPIKYKITVKNKDIDIKISYLFRLLFAKAEYISGKFSYQVKLLWKTIVPKEELTDEKKKKPREGKNNKSKSQEESNLEKTSNESDTRTDTNSIDESSKKDDTQSKEENLSSAKRHKKTADKSKKSIKSVIQKLKNKLIDIKKVSLEKMDFLAENYNNYADDTAKYVYSLLLKLVARLFKHLRPRRGKMDFTYGFEDPSTTGYILAVYSMIYPKVGKRLKLHPDFENAIYEGNGKIIGHLQLYVPVYILLRLYFDKKVKRFLDRR